VRGKTKQRKEKNLTAQSRDQSIAERRPEQHEEKNKAMRRGDLNNAKKRSK
jgi:hypothetical protein